MKLMNKYRLKDGAIDWHRLYFDNVPNVLRKYGPPFGSYNYAVYMYQPHKYVIELIDEVRYFIQRGKRGYSDRDVWSIDYYLAHWMPEALKQLERTKHGTPIGMTPKGWSTRLRIIREGFEAVKELGDTPNHERYQELKRKMDKGLKLFGEYFLNLWD